MLSNSYLSRKLHSLLGVIPLGLFLIEHMITNFAAYEGGPQAFKEAVAFLNGLPLVLVLEIVLIWLPLLFHGVYGVYVAYQSNQNTGQFKYARNWAFLAQRVTGLIAFVFIAWHLYQTRVQVALGNVTHEELGHLMHEIVMNPIYFALYLISVIAVSFHFSNGMWAFLVSWGITVGQRAQQLSARLWMVVFVIMSIMFTLALFAFRDAAFAAI